MNIQHMQDTTQGSQFQENTPVVLSHLSFKTDNLNYLFLLGMCLVSL